MKSVLPITPDLQPGFAIFCAICVMLGCITFVILNFLFFYHQRKKLNLSRHPRVWAQDLWLRFTSAFAKIEGESSAYTSENRDRVDFSTILVVVIACFSVAMCEYYGGSRAYGWLKYPIGLFSDQPEAIVSRVFETSHRAHLARLAYWSASTFVYYFVIPALFAKFVLKKNLKDIGLEFHGLLKDSWIYVGLYLIVMPFVTYVSTTTAFQRTYPFYSLAHESLVDFFLWELIYAAQFFALEFFYRGFLVHGIKHRFGFYAILLSVVPYCMIHFGKPLPETLGAVLAGLALGILSLFSRSIWLGILIHISVAVSMDLLSLAGQGKF